MLPEIFAKKFLEWLEEDAPYDDITTMLLDNECFEAILLAKSDGVVAGLDLLAETLIKFGLHVEQFKRDGEEFSSGVILATIRGDVRKILTFERTLLNILNRLCGIARLTRMVVKKAKAVNPNVRIAATRKTTPGLRFLEKYAVSVGGGDTHRFSLSDQILIKDNHVRAIGSVEEAIKRAKSKASFSHKIEIEVSSVEDALKAAELGADIIMLDNMSPGEIRLVVSELKRRGLRDRVLLEASGRINLENIEEYASTGVDVISLGIITHSAPSCDISLELTKQCTTR
ncbi:MAG: carboxylating nicotinate-nucleotide diphosphorylase [Candidatus Korarchaeota archaeon]|nr:carboxylating nicotinate-nucleotide diphosphorylase [Thermoproteota archaeon]MCR8462888.1 carboxylating nicotinate-nucleotide diphosphorylase [Thermoproteota archaeon]MCR8470360.1 carboxylating nicotinate-nucleotide diphosphorylase [Thermoproteota archaeon]MCR8472025.1 carboxylating nicotinate-nucleotide diphosphorylase [Thermoproteota archaeon]MCR8472964.1 carboxylating nicotinate-nucleotide diphosphorylase [Thermoproteota archaeon]